MRLYRTGPAGLSATQLYWLLKLRTDVFVVEQKAAYPELDGRDLEPDTEHLWLTEDEAPDRILSYLRVLAEPDGVRRIGRVCTAAEARGRGLSRVLLGEVLAGITDSTAVVLDAQAHLVDFYGAFGFTPTGPQYFDEDGIPHVPMIRVPSA